MAKVTFQEILEHFGGSHDSLADALTAGGWPCSRNAVTMWGGVIPDGRAFQIEVLSKGKFPAAQLPRRSSSAAA